MIPRLIPAGLVLGALVLMPLAHARQVVGPPSKPVRVRQLNADLHRELPKTLKALYEEADLVIDGTVVEVIPADQDIPGTYPVEQLVATTYRLAVSEAFKLPEGQGGPIGDVLVTRIGGVRDRGDHVARHEDPGFPLFAAGERYFLFLQHLREDEYAPLVGADSAFRLSQSDLRTTGKGSVAAEISKGGYGFLRRELLRLRGGDQ